MPSRMSGSVAMFTVTIESSVSLMTKAYSPRVQEKRSRMTSFTCASTVPIRSSGSMAPSSKRMAPSRRPGRMRRLASM